MFGLGIGELMVIGLLVLLFFGGDKLPKLGSSLGEAITNFKKGVAGTDNNVNKSIDKKNS